MDNRIVTEEMLNELLDDVNADGGRHIGQLFNNWKKRNKLSHVRISDVSYLFRELI